MTTDALEQVINETQSQYELLFDAGKFEQLQRVAKMYAASKCVPEHYQGNTADCAIAIQCAVRLGCNILAYLQQSYIVKGTPGIESKLAIALLNQSGRTKTGIDYEMSGEGDSRQCTAFVVDAQTGDRKSETVTWKTVVAEGWNKDGKTSKGAIIKSKWNTMPELMFKYRSAMWLIRTYYPDVILGLQSREELEDIHGISAPKSSLKPARPSVAEKLVATETKVIDWNAIENEIQGLQNQEEGRQYCELRAEDFDKEEDKQKLADLIGAHIDQLNQITMDDAQEQQEMFNTHGDATEV